MSKNRFLALSALLLLVVAAVAACAPATPEERVTSLRTRYEARVNGFYVEAEPQFVEPEIDAEGEPAEEAAEEADVDEEGEGEESVEAEVPVIQNAHLDLIVQHDANEMLPGVTVDITMVDANQAVKGSWRLWVDTSTLQKANQLQLVHVLEDVPYEEGDGFAAEVRPLAPEEYGDYQEYSDLQ